VRNSVAAEQAQDIDILLFNAVFAIDEDEGAAESGSESVRYPSGSGF
jgi:hypothetical protein